MYQSEMFAVIQKADKYKLKNIHTYNGYDGADILKLSFLHQNEMKAVKAFCKESGIPTDAKFDKPNKEYDLYAIFELADDIYSLL
jgi:hypothetical protein